MLTRGAEELTPPGAPVSLGEAVAAGGAAIALRSVETEDEAVTLGMELAQLALRTSDADPDAALELVRARFPDDPEFDADAAMARIAAALDAESAPPEAAVSAQATDSIPLDEAWTRMRALEAADSLDAEDERALTRLRARLGRELAADSLGVLNERLSDARDEASDLEDDLTAARRALREQEEEGGLFGWLLSTVDELGLTFGWGALYFASLTTLMKGQTPGKRALGIRVIRLDGQPIGWFHAFERAGGYAAGVATGLLGFAQILWDPNRQGIHDKIVGTVVVREGAPRAPGRWQGQA
ncbi:MAG: RDD family protein [Gemmatimonadetes bacterium]|nr:RDD family protein [Gemmatimonadota bacterium]